MKKVGVCGLCEKKDSTQVTMDRTEASGEVENVAFDSGIATSDSTATTFDSMAPA